MKGLRKSRPAAGASEDADLSAAVASLGERSGRAEGTPVTLGADAAQSPVEAETSWRSGRARRTRRTTKAAGRNAGATADVTAVNLLSPWVLDEIHVRSLRQRFGYAAVALVVVLALTWAGLNYQTGKARTALALEESAGTALAGQIAQLSPVRVYVSGVDARAQAVTDMMDGQVAFSEVMGGLQAALPPRASLDSMTVTLPTPVALGVDGAAAAEGAAATTGTTGAPAGTCPGPDPFAATDVVACLDLTGTASSRDVVSALVMRLDRNPLFAEPFVSTTTANEDDTGSSVAFVGSVALTAEVANTRFADLVQRLGSAPAAAAAAAAADTTEEQP